MFSERPPGLLAGKTRLAESAFSCPALGNTVLPRTSEAGPFGLDAEALHRVDHFFTELGAAIKDLDRLLRTWRHCRIAVTRYLISSLRIVRFGRGQPSAQPAFPSTDS